MGAFKRNRRPKEAVKGEYFYAKFDKEWRVVGECDRPKGMS